jgi:enoyl-CoA hydratase
LILPETSRSGRKTAVNYFMKPAILTGAEGRLDWTVTADRTITLGGDPRATVFATPFMIMLMERAAREALRPFLEEGEESVGIDVNVRHLAGAALGANVHAVATVTEVEGRKISFNVAAYEGDKLLGEGTHKRMVVELSRLVKRLGEEAANESSPVASSSLSVAPPAFDLLRLEIQGAIATVTLNRPSARNAISQAMSAEIEELVDWLSGCGDALRVVIVTGEGKAFCGGDDVKELESLVPEEARKLSLRQARMFLAFERLPQVLIAAVNGAALGAGCVFAYSCDLRLASSAARFGMPEILLGWPPGYGVAQLIGIVGKARAMELCLTGRIISAQIAADWGLVGEVVPGNRLLPRAMELAGRLLELPPAALRETKRLVHLDESPHAKVAHQLDTEAYVRCFEMEDASEGIRAFAEKRPPRFKGK